MVAPGASHLGTWESTAPKKSGFGPPFPATDLDAPGFERSSGTLSSTHYSVILNAVKDLRLPLSVSKRRYFRVVHHTPRSRGQGDTGTDASHSGVIRFNPISRIQIIEVNWDA
jgi:hypothetical protein